MHGGQKHYYWRHARSQKRPEISECETVRTSIKLKSHCGTPAAYRKPRGKNERKIAALVSITFLSFVNQMFEIFKCYQIDTIQYRPSPNTIIVAVKRHFQNSSNSAKSLGGSHGAGHDRFRNGHNLHLFNSLFLNLIVATCKFVERKTKLNSQQNNLHCGRKCTAVVSASWSISSWSR